MTAIGFRAARSSDAAALGMLHVVCWRESYAGLLPERLLDELSADARSSMWGAVLSEPAKFGRAAAFLAEDNGKVVGFGACSGQRDQALKEQGFEGEINAIYVLRSHQCLGAGRSLMRLLARTLMDQGRSAAALWVLRENARARHFYERLGGALAGEKVEEKAGVLLPEVAYGWSDLTRMADWTRS